MVLRRSAWWAAVVSVLAAVALSLVPGPALAAGGGSAGWTLPPLTTAHGEITDVNGRTVLLRGINVNQLNDYAINDPALPTVTPLTRTDFAGMAALGFNVVRLNVAWSALEPSPGVFDRVYTARIRKAVRDAADHGLYTVLDMHQDAWGKSVGTPADVTCPPLTNRSRGWDGAPAWATITDGWSTCNVGGVREITPAVARAFQNFYDDRRGIQTHLVRTWARLAAAMAGEPGVAGYDLLNEPNPGLRAPAEAAEQIGRYYQRVIAAIRTAERAAGGHRRLVFVEPSVLWSALGVDALPPQRLLTDDRLVFAPHLYNESIAVTGPVISIERGMALARTLARVYRAPLWVGEWGWFGAGPADGPKVARYAAAEDAQRIGGAWWVWKQACGDPHSIGSEAPASLNRVACPSGSALGPYPEFTGPLSRAYPRAAPGRLTQVSSDPVARRLTVAGTGARRAGSSGSGSGCRLEVWAPGAGRPAVTATNIGRLRADRLPGGWRVTGCASGAYRLTLR